MYWVIISFQGSVKALYDRNLPKVNTLLIFFLIGSHAVHYPYVQHWIRGVASVVAPGNRHYANVQVLPYQ